MRTAWLMTIGSLSLMGSCATMTERESPPPTVATRTTDGWTTDTTVGAIVTERPQTARVFELVGIDYCCGGQKPLGQAVADAGIDAAQLLRALAVVGTSAPDEGARDWQQAELGELIEHIVDTHHVWLRRELPVLSETARTVLRVHGSEHPELADVVGTLEGVVSAVIPHLAEEEQHTFPAVLQLAAGERPERVEQLLEEMHGDHDELGLALHRLRDLTGGFALPEGACAKYRELMDGLAALERDMHTHVHLENNVVLPRAMALLEAASEN